MMQEFYRRKLPHIPPKGATLFVTFRLAGSIPRSVLDALQEEKERELNRVKTVAERDLIERKFFGRFDNHLHTSTGPHHLKHPKLAAIVAESLHYRDKREYRLDAFTIMSNHVHVVFAPLEVSSTIAGEEEYHPLSKIMQSLKRHTARECNKLLGKQGAFWHAESYDHVIRDVGEWRRIVRYVINNPVRIGLVEEWGQWQFSYCPYL